jgi:uncharacterized protein (TIGR02246 family)
MENGQMRAIATVMLEARLMREATLRMILRTVLMAVFTLSCWFGLATDATSIALADTSMTCVQANAEEIAHLFDRWNAALQTGDPDAVVATYAPDAVLLPTMSNVPRDTPDEIRDYFVHFLAGHPVGRINQRFIRMGCNTATDSGLYAFTLAQQGKTVEVPARYTFDYVYRNGQWLIEEHHSSKMPEGPATTP